MQILLNSYVNPYINNNYSFKSINKKEEETTKAAAQPTKDEIITAKTKKAISECKYIIFGIFIMYFAMKRNFKINKINAQLQKPKTPTGIKAPKIIITKEDIEKTANGIMEKYC